MTAASDAGKARLDADDRARATALELDSFIVEAPAGAGKTELLTQRFLRLLATVESPEEIVAITFTNKAAAEMRERVLGALERARAGEAPARPHQAVTAQLALAALAAGQQRGWDLIGQPARLRILTIDALCASIARQMPLLSRFGEQPAIARDAAPLYVEAARQTLALIDDDDAALAAPVEGALAYLDNDGERLVRLLVDMLGRREQWLSRVSLDIASDAALAALVSAELDDIAGGVDASWQRALMPLANFAAANVDAESPICWLEGWEVPLPATLEVLPCWRALVELTMTQKDEWRKTVTIRQGFPAGKEFRAQKDAFLQCLAAATPDHQAVLARVRRLPSLDGREDEDAIVRIFASLLRLAVACLWQVFRARGEVDFPEIAMRAIDALGDAEGPSDLALKLDYRIRHLLVDEFQDTSPAQIRLLERLSDGWSAGDGRTLFCVGDPMQSIYRFRKADVALFLKASAEGIGGIRLQRLDLCRNNRSLPPVVDWINAAFAQAFPVRDRMFQGAVALRHSVATRELAGESTGATGVFFHPVLADGDKQQDDHAEALRVLELIDAARGDAGTRTVAVLVRARKHLDGLVAEIRRSRPTLRFQAVEIESLGDRPWVGDLAILTRALMHRADRVYWLALLRSPLCGLVLADLCVLAEDDHDSTLWHLMGEPSRLARLSADGRQRLQRLLAVLDEAFAAQGRQALARWVEGVWLLLGGPATLPDQAAVDDTEAYFGLLAELDASGRFDPDRLDVETARLFAAPDPMADDSLRLMTIHKSKGLEFDAVILPGLHRTVKGSGAQMLLWDDVVVPGAPPAVIVAPLPPRRVGHPKADAPSAYEYLQGLERERSRNEDLRVLYVAATRARRALHLVGVLERENADGGSAAAFAPPPANTPLADLWASLQGMLPMVPVDTPAAPGAESCKLSTGTAPGNFVPAMRRLRAVVVPALPEGPAVRDPVGGAALAGREFRAERAFSSTDAAFGTLTHRYLELMAIDPDAWTVDRLSALRPAMARWLRGQHLDGPAVDAMTGRLTALLGALLASERGRWVLQRRPAAAAELALAAGGQVSVIDRTFVEDGVRWIIDYKTTATAGLDAADCAALAGQHRSQLEAYAKLFAGEGLPVRTAVFFVDGARWVELPVPAGGTGVT